MNTAWTEAREPVDLRVVGTFRLTQAIHDQVSKLRSVQEVCLYLLDLVPLLLDADAMSIELPEAVSPKPFRTPEGFFVEASPGSGDPVGQPVQFVDTTVPVGYGAAVRLCIYYAHKSSEVGPQGAALLDFIASCFCPFVEVSLSAKARASALTPAERKVLSLLDYTIGEISQRLYISPETVKVHRKHIFRKLGVHHREEALQVARNAGLMA